MNFIAGLNGYFYGYTLGCTRDRRMNRIMKPEGGFPRGLIGLRRVGVLLVLALSFLSVANGFAQLIYLSDSRSVSGYANVNWPSDPIYYTTSFTGNFSGSASPSAPFADFATNLSGSATLIGGFFSANPAGGGMDIPITVNSSVSVSQNSFLHPQELNYSSFEGNSGTLASSGANVQGKYWYGGGGSSLQVSFEVLSPVPYTLWVSGTGDPVSVADSYTLSSAAQGVLVSSTSTNLLNYWGPRIYYSGVFNPSDIYTLTLTSNGENDGGGLMADLTVPEPSTAGLAGLALLVFCFGTRCRVSKEHRIH
jgi:hypothetical protein